MARTPSKTSDTPLSAGAALALRSPGASEQVLTELDGWVRRDRDRWASRNERFHRDQDTYQLAKPSDAGAWARNGKDLVILNDPKVLVKKLSRIIARHPNVIEVVASRPDLVQTAQRMENWLYGWDQSVSQRWMLGLNNPYRYDQSFYLTLRGWLTERTLLRPEGPDEDGYDPSALYNHQVIDPATVYPLTSGGEIIRVSHVYRATIGELRFDPLFFGAEDDVFGDAEDSTMLTIQGVYWKALDGGWYHAITTEGQWVKPPTELGYNPWTIVTANGVSYRWTEWDDIDYFEQIGTGVLDESSEMHKHLSRMATKLNTLLSLEANPPVTYLSADGKPRRISLDPGSRIFGANKDKIEIHRVGPQLGDFKLLWDLLSERAERAGFPAAMFGQGGPESGLASAVLLSAGKDLLFPFVEALNMADALKYRKVLEMYRDHGPGKPLQARELSPLGTSQLAEITSQDIQAQGVYVEVTRGDMTPQETVQKLNLALGLLDKGVLSLRTVRGRDYLGLKNPDAENLQVLSEKVYMSDDVIKQLIPVALSDTGQQMLQSLWATIQSGMPAPGSPATPTGAPIGPGAPGGPAGPGLPTQVLPPGAINPLATNNVSNPNDQMMNQLLGLLTGGATGGAGAGGLPPNPALLSAIPPILPPGAGGPLV